MYVTGRNDRFLELVSKFDDLLVDLDQVLVGIYAVIFFICDHKRIVSKRLDLQIIIKIDKSRDLRFRCISKQCLIQFARFAGTSDQKSLSEFKEKALRHTRPPSVIFQMRLAYQFVQVHASCLISGKDDCMISREFLDRVDRDISLLIQRIYIKNIPLPKHLHKPYKDLGRTRRIIYCPVVMIQRNTDCLGNCIQLESVQCRQKESCHSNGVHIRIFLWKPLTLTVLNDKTHIKVCIVRDHHRTLTEFQELRKDRLDIRCIHDHRIIDAGQLLDPVRDRYLRIDKSGKTVCDHTLFDTYRTDLNDLTGQRGKSCRLDIKYDKFAVHRLSLAVGNDPLEVIYEIRFHTVEYLEIRVLRHTAAPCIKAMVCLRECLYNTMVCDRDRLVSPFIRTLNEILCCGNTIHITHLGMAVKLDSLLRTGVHPHAPEICYLLDPGD